MILTITGTHIVLMEIFQKNETSVQRHASFSSLMLFFLDAWLHENFGMQACAVVRSIPEKKPCQPLNNHHIFFFRAHF